jgi:hypothetical protein
MGRSTKKPEEYRRVVADRILSAVIKQTGAPTVESLYVAGATVETAIGTYLRAMAKGE